MPVLLGLLLVSSAAVAASPADARVVPGFGYAILLLDICYGSFFVVALESINCTSYLCLLAATDDIRTLFIKHCAF